MRARDVHDKLKGRVDTVLLDVLCTMADELHALSRAIPEMGKSFEKLADVLQMHTNVLEKNKDVLKTLQKRVGDVKSVPADEGTN